MTPELRKLTFKFLSIKSGVTSEEKALNVALIHITQILKTPIFWVEKGSQAEAQFGVESTEEYWQGLKKEIQQILSKK